MTANDYTNPAIIVNGLSKGYEQGAGLQTIRDVVIHGLSRSASKFQTLPGKFFWALRDISFQIPRGSTVGIIGHNGAGKTTLLRLLSGLTQPTHGVLQVSGMVSAMLSLTTSLNPDLSGRKNIHVNGIYRGVSWGEAQQRTQEIIDFANLGEFIDHPVRTYSSGMQARLSFSIVTGFGLNDVLLIDEALGAGDARFSPKAWKRMREYIESGRTVILVSHSMETIRSLCERAIWLDHGRVRMDASASEVADAYLEATSKKRESRLLIQLKKKRFSSHFDINRVGLQNGDREPCEIFKPGNSMRIEIDYHNSLAQEPVRFLLDIQRADGALVSTSCIPNDRGLEPVTGRGRLIAFMEPLALAQGVYHLKITAGQMSGEPLVETYIKFEVEDPKYGQRGGIPLVLPQVDWTWERGSG